MLRIGVDLLVEHEFQSKYSSFIRDTKRNGLVDHSQIFQVVSTLCMFKAVGEPDEWSELVFLHSNEKLKKYREISKYIQDYDQNRLGIRWSSVQDLSQLSTVSAVNLIEWCVDFLDYFFRTGKLEMAEAYQIMLDEYFSQQRNGSITVSRMLVKSMIEMAAPMANEGVCDLNMNDGSILIQAAAHSKRLPTLFLNPDQARGHYMGMQRNAELARYAAYNLRFNSVYDFTITMEDVSEADSHKFGTFDLIVAQIPISGQSTNINRRAFNYDYEFRTTRLDLLYLQWCHELLKPSGRAMLIVPDSIFWRKTNVFQSWREWLVNENRIRAIISLPVGIIPKVRINFSILYFEKGGLTSDVWCFDARSGHSPQNRQKPDILEQVQEGYRSWTHGLFHADNEEMNRMQIVNRDEIESHQYQLYWMFQKSEKDNRQEENPIEVLQEIKEIEEKIHIKLRMIEEWLRNELPSV
ncbi:MAG: adenine-specific methylase 3 [Paenibacillus sp.]|nr:adenine-specific methylase 3 [Paenibacillus sp.]